MYKMNPGREVNYLTKFTPITGTAFASMIHGVYFNGTSDKVCLATPVQQVPATFDTVLTTKNCKNLHRFLSEEKYADELIIQKMVE